MAKMQRRKVNNKTHTPMLKNKKQNAGIFCLHIELLHVKSYGKR